MTNIPKNQDDFNKLSFPNVILEPFLADSYQSCMLFAALRFAGVDADRLVTVDYAHQVYSRYVPDVHEQWVRRALSHDLFFSKKRVITKKRGKPARMYRMPSHEQIAAHYGTDLHGSSYTFIPEDTVGHRPRFTIAVHEGLIARRSGQYTRQWLADRLGVGKSTLRKWEKRYSRVMAHPVIKEVLRITSENVHALLHRIPEKAKPGPQWLSIRFPSSDGKGKEVFKRRATRHNVLEAIKFFKEVVLVEQECSYYRMRTADDYLFIGRGRVIATDAVKMLHVGSKLFPLGPVPKLALPDGYVQLWGRSVRSTG